MMRVKAAFTLVEVNLAIFIMAGGVLAMVSLYSLGFRESQQSRDDVAAAGYADAFFAPIVAGLSATNVQWSAWRNIGNSIQAETCDAILPDNGWSAYVESVGNSQSLDFRVKPGCNGTADGVMGDLLSAARGNSQGSIPGQKPKYYAMVATRRGGTISLGFRSCHRRDQLMSQPIYYTEVHFQGDPNQ